MVRTEIPVLIRAGIFFSAISEMKRSEAFEMGFVARTHGLKGGLVVALHEDIPLSMKSGDALFVEMEGVFVPYFIKEISVKGDKAYLTFQEIESIESAQGLVRKKIYLPKSARPRLRGISFYDDEVEGFRVQYKEEVLGLVSGIVWSGPQRMIEVTGGRKELLIPVNEVFITKLDRKAKVIQVELPEGFLDL
jgi:16S rRNA processing protein RimM